MTDYPLPTLTCTIDSTGISAPAFNDILLSLQASYRAIYGLDTLLDPDEQDMQWITIQAKAISDTNQSMIFVFNQFSPATSQGAGLSSVVKINGIERLIPTNSTAVVTIIGQAGRQIINGLVGDNENKQTQWALAALVVIPTSGSIDVSVTCLQPGAIIADPGTLTVILTPTVGWQTVSNAVASAPGAPVEIDAELRKRQSFSTQLPSQSVLGGMVGRIANLPGVTSIKAYENDTNAVDANTLPPHSICVSVLGGDAQSIIDLIGSGKTEGCVTYGGATGGVTGTYIEPVSGYSYTIHYNVPALVTIDVIVNIKAGIGYTSTIGIQIVNAVAVAINDLDIGQDVEYTRLYIPALLAGRYMIPSQPTNGSTYELTSVLISRHPATPIAADVIIAYNEYAVTNIANIILVAS
jgi:uncharacterized phage protein gp47/JayE